jgi:hypothetical protein
VREAQSIFTIILDRTDQKHRSPLQVIPPGVGPGGLAALLLLDESRLRGMKVSLLIA